MCPNTFQNDWSLTGVALQAIQELGVSQPEYEGKRKKY